MHHLDLTSLAKTRDKFDDKLCVHQHIKTQTCYQQDERYDEKNKKIKKKKKKRTKITIFPAPGIEP